MKLTFDDPARVETRTFKTPKGEELTVQMTREFENVLRSHFSLSANETVSDDHVRMFLWGALNSAVEKEERRLDVEGYPV